MTWTYFLKVMVVISLAGSVPGCHQYQDVSRDAHYGGDQIVGRCFTLVKGGYVVLEGTSPPYLAAPAIDYPPLVEFRSGRWDRGRYPDGINIRCVVEPGTRIRVEKLVHDIWLESDELRPLAKIVTGPCAGSPIYIGPPMINSPSAGRYPAIWSGAENNEFLAPCGVSETGRPKN